MLARGDLALEADIRSDTAPLGDLVETLLAAAPSTRWLRDPTRGGLGTVCNELAQATNLAVVLDEAMIPIDPAVNAACDLLGIDPLYVANEGKLVAIVAPDEADAALAALPWSPSRPGGRGDRSDQRRSRGHRRAAHDVRRHAHRRHARRRPAPADLLMPSAASRSGSPARCRASASVRSCTATPPASASRGWVQNDSAGVLIEVEGDEGAVLEVSRLLVDDPPPLARVGTITATPVPVEGDTTFSIVESESGGAPTAAVSVDTATCAACLAEVDDPTDRRYRYPFTNCTDCGPRYTIVRSRCPTTAPARRWPGSRCARRARPSTTIRSIAASTPSRTPARSAGPACSGVDLEGDAALEAAIAALEVGGIVAVKGIGGFHLAVDAANEAAVGELRRRKARDDKPFAVMVHDLDEARTLCTLTDAAADALTSPGGRSCSRRVEQTLPSRAVSLRTCPSSESCSPYSPLHHLLLRGVGRPLVMTSGNVSDEPIAHKDDDASERLAASRGRRARPRPRHPHPLRRLRCPRHERGADSGAASLARVRPQPLSLVTPASRPILAVGAELKSTVAVTVGDDVVVSHHIGDLEHLATYRSFLQAIDHLCALYAVTPEVVAHDLHPEYLSTKLATDLDLPPIAVQHHHAHVASCLTEHGRTGPGARPGLRRPRLRHRRDAVGRRAPRRRPPWLRAGRPSRPGHDAGGVAAIREPWRMGVAWAHRAGVDDRFDDSRRDAVLDLVAPRARTGDHEHGTVVRRGRRAARAASDASPTRRRPPSSSRRWPDRCPAPRRRRSRSRSAANASGSSSSTRRRSSPRSSPGGHGTVDAGGRGRVPRVDRSGGGRGWCRPGAASTACRRWPSPAACSRTFG